MLPLKDDFKAGEPLNQVTADWLNTVAAFINTFQVSGTLVMERPAMPTKDNPVRVIGYTALQSPAQ